MANSSSMSVAQRRWKLLGEVLKKKRCHQNSNSCYVSVRRFTSFGLLHTELLPREVGEPHLWHLDGTIEWADLLGFNNTGNVCVWPAEEVLTYYCLGRLEYFKNKSICELGGGMTCLAGMFLAVNSQAKELLLTDGNEQSVKNIAVTIDRNQEKFADTKVSSRLLRWDDSSMLSELYQQFDCIICADCLFFDDCREDLLKTMDSILKPDGEAIVLAPSRGGTFNKFLELCRSCFQVTSSENYDNHLWELHLRNKKDPEMYDENIHYPLLMTLHKTSMPSKS